MVGEQHHTTEIQQGSFLLLLAVVTILFVWIAWPFFTPILWSVLAAIMFQPLYKWILVKFRGRRNPAAIVTLTVIILAVVAPALWIGTLVVEQALNVIATLQDDPVDLTAWFTQIYQSLPLAAQNLLDESGWSNTSEAQERT